LSLALMASLRGTECSPAACALCQEKAHSSHRAVDASSHLLAPNGLVPCCTFSDRNGAPRGCVHAQAIVAEVAESRCLRC